ncbi:BN860_11276g1_1 [Zygosaccharomyces bailii CLIB 213]|uniref:2'-phosphotransferase n=1 Tax=Zygosaccharomyces bailii (strain CLIB 213 / ATCC 58445 / CBS 680 / BCRC 21525 / NBRC 1098 / NCYC 1416 / NRRL Y-2227) TaxID=1333698 RepID=A0A8J2T329_ZYGB2|nr:BN860_11276g1_1 [Zygosaccharomyces bailii CLIB 213]
MNKRDTQISKSMSYLLRHAAIKEQLPIDSNGYVSLPVLLAHNRLKTHKCTVEDIHRIVDCNEKKRFHLKDSPSGELICATQGHSIRSLAPGEEVLHEITTVKELPPKLIHGTTIRKALLILETGVIKRLSRNHVHLSPGITGVDAAVVSGMRSTSSVHIYIKRDQQLLDQLHVYKSLNDVYLVPGDVPSSFFEKVTIRLTEKHQKASEDIDKLFNLLDGHRIPYEMLS